jgi:3-hexulose-6-phosphate synthase
MKLQIAIDIVDTAGALDITSKISDIIDIVEIGTPMILREGMVPVKTIKDRYPHLTVLADTKIVDGGDLECGYACEAGADIITVLAVSADATISDVVSTAHKNGRRVMADLISVEDIAGRARAIEALGVDFISVHTAVDVQKLGRTPLKDLSVLVSAVAPEKTAVAGGIKLSTIADYKKLNPAIVIAGSSLTASADIRAAVVDMKAAIQG